MMLAQRSVPEGGVSVTNHRRNQMPIFFIDTSDGDFFDRDERGRDYADVDSARDAAVDSLPDMARELLPDGDRRLFLAVVRDDNGRILVKATLTLEVVWNSDALT